jgi:MinD superfamily P-loop ATPase
MPIVGVVENMKTNKANTVEAASLKLGLKYIGSIPFDSTVEEAIGNPEKLLDTALGKSMTQIKKLEKTHK